MPTGRIYQVTGFGRHNPGDAAFPEPETGGTVLLGAGLTFIFST